ncbi:MAG: class I SAM-dependent methyltransferase [Acidobacteria bacterium]|nr:class I SAM-dependent methyltransferase [Acidobacteriota bacterium]MBI3656887.1 class I SAM-dependent methyltransferase [Acidobacteriota bacterium]
MSSPFDDCAFDYNQCRPDYPQVLFDDLLTEFRLPRDALIIDIGAGTGRAALAMAARRVRVIGLDPSPPMLEEAKRNAIELGLLSVSWHVGAAEDTGLPSGIADAIIMAQAFHWVRPAEALTEFQRVLKPGGGLAVFWNSRDLTQPHLLTMEKLIKTYNPQCHSRYQEKAWGDVIDASGRFHNIRHKLYRHSSRVSIEGIISLTRSFSYVRNVLDEARTLAFEMDLREQMAALAQDGMLEMAYITDLWCAESKP